MVWIEHNRKSSIQKNVNDGWLYVKGTILNFIRIFHSPSWRHRKFAHFSFLKSSHMCAHATDGIKLKYLIERNLNTAFMKLPLNKNLTWRHFKVTLIFSYKCFSFFDLQQEGIFSFLGFSYAKLFSHFFLVQVSLPQLNFNMFIFFNLFFLFDWGKTLLLSIGIVTTTTNK